MYRILKIEDSLDYSILKHLIKDRFKMEYITHELKICDEDNSIEISTKSLYLRLKIHIKSLRMNTRLKEIENGTNNNDQTVERS